MVRKVKHVEITVKGPRPEHPKEVVLAMEAIVQEFTSGPAEGSMALLVAYVHVHRAYLKRGVDEMLSTEEALAYAMQCVDQWWPNASDEIPDDYEADNQNTRH